MKRPVFEGSAVAIVTPFSKVGVDYKKLGELVDFQLDNKTDAIIVCGTTGEASTMPDEEHLATVRFVIEKVKGRVPVVAGTSSNDTAHGIELCKKATELGADALLSVTPYYNKTSQEGLYRHFKLMAESTHLPIILYNVPSRTNLNIQPQTAYRLSEFSNIVALKECNLLQVPEVARLCKDDLILYSGEDGLVVPMLSLGAKGVISVAANVIPAEMSKLVHSFLDGDIQTSLQIQLDYLPFINALFSDVNPIPVKEALNILGWEVGECRMPLCEMTPECKSHLECIMSQYTFTHYDS
jgi:4-hydroxy-tetrahydrodipicolinate synthase